MGMSLEAAQQRGAPRCAVHPRSLAVDAAVGVRLSSFRHLAGRSAKLTQRASAPPREDG